MATALKTVPDSISRRSPCWLDSWGCRWRIVAKQLRFLAPSQQLPPPLLWRLLLACWAWSRFSEGKKRHLWSQIILVMCMARAHRQLLWCSCGMANFGVRVQMIVWLLSPSLLGRRTVRWFDLVVGIEITCEVWDTWTGVVFTVFPNYRISTSSVYH